MEVIDCADASYWSPVKITTQLLLDAVTQAAAAHARGRLVDLGCGMKPYEPIFRPHVASYFGVDFGQTAALHYGSETKADLFVDGTDTKLAEGSFETVLSTQVLEHVLDTNAYVAECRRLLAPGGKGIFTIPFVWQTHAEPNDFYRFTRYALEQIFQKHGFRIIAIRPIGGAYATLMQMKILTLHCRNLDSLAYRILRKLRNLVLLPYWNWKGLYLDNLFWNEKLCLNYLVVIQK